ncbi:MAG TPA: hypothetical protein VFQ53_19855 [Kofleriaceae bacterium]|nr:hypothetical protein [Kofleriaceae bacterium]
MSHLSSLTIDALAGGHLDDAEARALRPHLEACARCRDELATAEAACRQFTRDVLPRTIGRLRPRPARWRWLVPVIAPVLAAAAIVLWLVRPAGRPARPVVDDDIRLKGDLTFQMFARRGDAVIAVRDGTPLAAGDQIRFVVGANGPTHLIVASIDGAGHATIYYPYDGTRSGSVGAQPAELPGSIVLDASPGPERVFAIASTESLDAAIVKHALIELGARGTAAIRDTRRLAVPAAMQASIVFEKSIFEKVIP